MIHFQSLKEIHKNNCFCKWNSIKLESILIIKCFDYVIHTNNWISSKISQKFFLSNLVFISNPDYLCYSRKKFSKTIRKIINERIFFGKLEWNKKFQQISQKYQKEYSKN